MSEPTSFLARNEFLIRRLHSLAGLIPVGAYMVVHLLVNASVLNSPGTFQKNVYQIHELGRVLWIVEWGFIFIPILFHAIFGVIIIRGGFPNSSTYAYASNVRYTLQRFTGMLAFFFIAWHVFHMHGWFHADWWVNMAESLQGAKFRPFNAASTAAAAMQQSILVPIAYIVGVLACVFHLANGIWTMGITWGVWTSPVAQRRATAVCTVFGIGLAAISLSAVAGFSRVDVDAAKEVEDRMYNSRVASGDVEPTPHKRTDGHTAANHDDTGNSEPTKTSSQDTTDDRLSSRR